MSHSLTSHEDLTPYIQQLVRINSLATNEMERSRNFAASPEIIIQELLTEIMSGRKYLKQATSIAEKFLEAYQTTGEEVSRLRVKNESLQEDIGELNTRIQKYEKEIEIKDNRYESIALEATDMERVMKMLNSDISHLKKEKDLLKKEIAQKEQAVIVRENTIQQRQKMIIEVEKDKEVDKGLQLKYDCLIADNKKKQAEIDELNNRINEIENIVIIEKNNTEKVKTIMQQLKNDNSIKKSELEEMKQKYMNAKEKYKQCNEELVQQKSFNEGLVKEYDRQRRKSVTSIQRDSVEITEEVTNIIQDKAAHMKSESIGEIMQELDITDPQLTDTSFFILASPSTDQSSPKFMLCQSKKICKCDEISIIPAKNNIQLCSHHIIDIKKTLSIDKVEYISIQKIQVFHFDDAASGKSDETETIIRTRKSSVIDTTRDPIKEFFIFVTFI